MTNTAQQPVTETKTRPIDLARERLKLMSEEVADLVQDGTFFTINDAIMETMYKDEENRLFKTYRQWKKEGYQVNKGEKAFILWARPKDFQIKLEESKTQEEKEKTLQFFPLAYLFSNAQVTLIDEEPTSTNLSFSTTKPTLEPLEY